MKQYQQSAISSAKFLTLNLKIPYNELCTEGEIYEN